ncbi:DoxX family protein [Cyclobacteriaceae bacterium]|nr:DoxX family protein [Cyclobacteriaceae bacterium]
MVKKLLETSDNRLVVFVRLMVGTVFLSEGMQKFLYPELRGAGRLAREGFEHAEFLGTFVGGFEVASGICILLGLFTRLAAVPTLIIMIVAFATTKAAVFQNDGFWMVMHGARTDWSMLLGSLFLIFSGGGKWSVDRLIR